MTLTEAQVKTVLRHSGPMQLSQLSLSLMLTRHKSLYSANPAAPVLKKCADELNVFLAKYGSIMKKDYDWMISL